MDHKQLTAFAYVVEEQSFEKAATMLHVSQSAISQRIKALESQLGQALLIRSTPLRPTDAGLKVLGYYQQMNLIRQELLSDLDPDRSKSGFSNLNKVRIAINADSLDTWFLGAIAPVIEEHQLLFDLKVDDQDATHELLKNGEVLGCISSNVSHLQGCESVLLGYMHYYPVCTQEYKDRYFPKGVKAEHFHTAPVVEFSYKDQLQSRYLQQYWGIGVGEYPAHEIPSSKSFFEFLVMGLGWGMVPDIQVQHLLDDGRLIKLTPKKFLRIPLYWHVWNLKSNLIKSITKSLQDRAKIDLKPN